MARFLVMASGRDRPGIVAGVTTVLAAAGANLEDTSMTKLGGRFAMLLMVAAKEPASLGSLYAALEDPARRLDLKVSIDEVTEPEPQPEDSQPHYTVTVYGADHPGIVAAISSELASAGANVCDLSTRLIGEQDAQTYTMLIDVTLPTSSKVDALTEKLAVLASQLDVTCHLQPVDPDTF